LAFAGTNEHPYQSVGRWLLDQNLTKDATWPGIKAWLAQNPRRTNELMWRNPRFIFFKEEALEGAQALLGPKGAMGVPLTPGRSIAVDPGRLAIQQRASNHSQSAGFCARYWQCNSRRSAR
jgi:membrane-bound lytic murein transglycosylase A